LLLAVVGLYEHDIGNDRKARLFLKRAIKLKVDRPKAGIVLAKLRFAEAIQRPAGKTGKLSAQQVSSILEPLRTPRNFHFNSEAYHSIVETWDKSEGKPDEHEADEIVKGIEQFPRDIGLLYSFSIVCARCGYISQAAELIDKGLSFTPPGENRERIVKLRATISAALEKSAK
jgi:hypothetical protein